MFAFIVGIISWLHRIHTHAHTMLQHMQMCIISANIHDHVWSVPTISGNYYSNSELTIVYVCVCVCAHAHVDHIYWMSHASLCECARVYVDQFRCHMHFNIIFIYSIIVATATCLFCCITAIYWCNRCQCTEKFHHVMYNRPVHRSSMKISVLLYHMYNLIVDVPLIHKTHTQANTHFAHVLFEAESKIQFSICNSMT